MTHTNRRPQMRETDLAPLHAAERRLAALTLAARNPSAATAEIIDMGYLAIIVGKAPRAEPRLSCLGLGRRQPCPEPRRDATGSISWSRACPAAWLPAHRRRGQQTGSI